MKNINKTQSQHINRNLNWKSICNAVKHEMSPQLANSITKIIEKDNDMNILDIPKSNTIKQLFQLLIKHKGSYGEIKEEEQYLAELIKRAIFFNPNQSMLLHLVF